MATSKTFTVTGTKNGTTFTVDLSSDKIIFVRANGSGADIHYDDSGLRKVITVDQTPAAISTASDFLIAVTDNAEGDTLYINADRVMAVNTARTTEADILYRVIGHSQVVLEVDESKASIQTAISAIVSDGGGDVTTGYTAHAGGGQADATQLGYGYSEVTTVATTGDSVKIPVAVNGARVEVLNDGANTMDLYPATGDTINDGAANSPIAVPPGVSIVLTAINGTNWETSGQKYAASDGSVGLPSFTFNNYPTMGMYAVSSVQLGFAVNGALGTLFDTSGVKSDSVRNRVNLGTTPVGTVSIVEYGDGRDITTVLTLTNFIVGALAGAAANLGVGNIVYAFPAGQHMELVYSLSSISLTAAGTAVNTDTGLGSVIASGAVAVLSGTATFEDRLTGQTIATAPGGGAAVSAITAATAGIGTGIALNGTGAVKNVFLNSAGTWNVDNTGNLTASGTIILKWTKMS